MCPVIGKVVSTFQLLAPSAKASLCDRKAVQELTGKLVRWDVLEKEVPIPSLLGDFSLIFWGDATLCLEHPTGITFVGVNNTLAGCAGK